MANVFISIGNSELYFGLFNLQVIVLIAMTPFMFRNIINLIDIKYNNKYYERKARIQTTIQLKDADKLIKCQSCNYMCRKGWKRCPICHKKL